MTLGFSSGPTRCFILFASLLVTFARALPTSSFGIAVKAGYEGASAATDSLKYIPNSSAASLYASHDDHVWRLTDSPVITYMLQIIHHQKRGNNAHASPSLQPSDPSIIFMKRSSTPLFRRQTTGTDRAEPVSDSSSDDHPFPLYMKIIIILASVVGGILLLLTTLWLIVYLTTRSSRTHRRDIPSGSPFLPPRANDYHPLLDDSRPSRGGLHVRDDSLFYFPVAHAQEPYRDNEIHDRVVVGKGKGKAREEPSRLSNDYDDDPFSDDHDDVSRKRRSRVEEVIPNPFADHTPARTSEEIELRDFRLDDTDSHRV